MENQTFETILTSNDVWNIQNEIKKGCGSRDRVYSMTGSSPRCPLRSHSLVCIENHLFIVGIGPILNKELEFIYQSDRSDRTYV